MPTNDELVAFAVARLGLPYMYGNNGKLITEALIQQTALQYPLRYTQQHIDKLRESIGLPGYQCNSFASMLLRVQRSANDWLAAATVKGPLNYNINKGPIQPIPEIPGLSVHYNGHMGIYEGNGNVIEARGTWSGVVRTRIEDRGWTSWARVPGITYGEDDMLQKGDDGRPVYDLQVALKALGYDLGQFKDYFDQTKITGLDGEYGGTVEGIIKDVQTKAKLPITGKADSATMARIAQLLATAQASRAALEAAQAEAIAARKAAEDAKLAAARAQAQVTDLTAKLSAAAAEASSVRLLLSKRDEQLAAWRKARSAMDAAESQMLV